MWPKITIALFLAALFMAGCGDESMIEEENDNPAPRLISVCRDMRATPGPPLICEIRE